MGIGQRKNEKEENKIEHNLNDRVAQLEKNTAQAHLETKCGESEELDKAHSKIRKWK